MCPVTQPRCFLNGCQRKCRQGQGEEVGEWPTSQGWGTDTVFKEQAVLAEARSLKKSFRERGTPLVARFLRQESLSESRERSGPGELRRVPSRRDP